jgi:hypothetical protein
VIDARDVLDLAVGTYVATLAVAAAGVTLPAVGPGPAPTLYAGVGVGAFAVGLAGARSASALPGALTPRRSVTALAVPVAWFVVAAVDGGVVRYPLGVGAAGVVPGGVAAVAANELRVRERIGDAATVVAFEARPAPRARKLYVGAYAGLVAVLVGGSGLVVAFGGDLGSVGSVLPALGGSAAGLPAVVSEREVEVLREGVRVGRTFHRWDRFDGYAVDDDAVVLARSGYRGSYRFDRSDVDDVEALGRALGRFLPRREDRRSGDAGAER